MRPSRLFPRGRFVLVCVATTLAAAAPACLPDVEFDGAATDGGPGQDGDAVSPDGTAPPTDGATTDGATTDGATDASVDHAGDVADSALDALVDSAMDSETGVSPLGPFVVDLNEDYGETAACAVYSGQLYCWATVGGNSSGQLGLPADQMDGGGHPTPTLITSNQAPASEITSIAMGALHSCSLYGRTAYCRGDNDDNQLGNNGGPTSSTETAVQGAPAVGFDKIAAAELSTCGIITSTDAGLVSNVICWGTNGEGELGRPIGTYPPTAVPVTGDVDGGPLGAIPDAIDIAGGGYHHCAISQSRGILCWGASAYMESGPVAGNTDCPGGNTPACRDQPEPVTLPNGEVPKSLALGAFHSCALTQAGNVYCWGWNPFGELGIGSTMLTQSCTDGAHTAPCTGTPMQVAISNVVTLRAGGAETCAIDVSHHAYCWGDNDEGQIGNADSSGDNVDSPAEVTDVNFVPQTFDDISVGYDKVCASRAGALYCWGGGALGTQTPDGGTPSQYSPALVQLP